MILCSGGAHGRTCVCYRLLSRWDLIHQRRGSVDVDSRRTLCVCLTAAVALPTVLDIYIGPRRPSGTDTPTIKEGFVRVTGATSSKATSKKDKEDKAPVTKLPSNTNPIGAVPALRFS